MYKHVSAYLKIGALNVSVSITYKESSSVEGHPDAILHVVSNEPHVLNSSGRSSIVWNPVVLPGGPG
jgi:hypothetical protein